MLPLSHSLSQRSSRRSAAFTLVEMITAMGILSLLMVVIMEVTNQTSKVWTDSTSKIKAFQQARAAFESMTRRISQATLNTYYQVDTNGVYGYVRKSELHFISGPATMVLTNIASTNIFRSHALFFQAPVSEVSSDYKELDNLLSACGFYVDFKNDPLKDSGVFFAKKDRYRYRLMQSWPTASQLSIFHYTSGQSDYLGAPGSYYKGRDWIYDNNTNITLSGRMIAENVVALIFLPKKSLEDDPTGFQLAKDYLYDSRDATVPTAQTLNQLPPLVQVTMVALDDPSAARLEAQNATLPPDLGVDKLFLKGQSYDDLQADLDTLEKTLKGKGLKYRIFTTDVSIRGAKWSN